MLCVKGQKIGTKKTFHEIFFCIFYIGQKKMSVFHKTCRTYVERRDVRYNFLFGFFLRAKMFFPVAGAYTPMCQSEFPF